MLKIESEIESITKRLMTWWVRVLLRSLSSGRHLSTLWVYVLIFVYPLLKFTISFQYHHCSLRFCEETIRFARLGRLAIVVYLVKLNDIHSYQSAATNTKLVTTICIMFPLNYT